MSRGKTVPFVFFLIIMSMFSAPAGADVITPSGDDNYINNDTVINVSASPYNIDDPNSNGVLIINASHVTLDCNGSVFNGTTDYWRRGLNISNFENVTVKNCVFKNYYYGMWIYPNAHNTTLFNNTVHSNFVGIYIEDSDRVNMTGNNASFNGGTGTRFSSSWYMNVTQNTFDHNGVGLNLYFSNGGTLIQNNLSSNSGTNLEVVSIFYHTIGQDNLVNDLPVYYFSNHDNLVLDGNGTSHLTVANSNNVTIKNMNLSYGDPIHLYYVSNSSISNNIVRNASYGLRISSGCDNNTIENNTLFNIVNYGIYLYEGDLNTIRNNNISSCPRGAYVHLSDGNLFLDNTLTSNERAFYVLSSDGNNFTDNTLDSNEYGLYFMDDSTQNIAANMTINSSRKDAIYLLEWVGSYPHDNKLANITVTGTNSSYNDINFASEGINGTILEDMRLTSYSFTGAGGTLHVINSYGEVRFLEPVNGSGNNMSSDMRIENNLITVESSVSPGLNRSANITLYGLPTGFANPVILRNGIICPADMCHNFTSLNAGTVRFNVSHWTNYSIGENPNYFSSCQTLSDEGKTYYLTQDIVDPTSGDPCILINAHNITLDCQGFNLTGDSDWGISVDDADNVTVRNCRVYNFTMTGINFYNSSFGLVEYNVVSNMTLGQGMDIANYCQNNTIRFNNATYNGLSGLIAIENTSRYNLFYNNTMVGNLDHGMEAEHGAHHNYFINNTIIGNNVTGMKLSPNSHHNLVKGNLIRNNGMGISTSNSSSNVIEDNCISDNPTNGISIGHNSSGNLVYNNNIENCSNGAVSLVSNTWGNNITNNSLYGGDYGIFTDNSSNITISRNFFGGFTGPEIQMVYAVEGIVLYGNVFTSKDKLLLYGSLSWDNGSIGNRWKAYDQPSEGCQDTNSDGICDSSYSLGSGNTDYLPVALVKGAYTSSDNGVSPGGSPSSFSVPPECESDPDCPYYQTCENETCVNVSCGCGYPENHTCIGYDCCWDGDCPVNHSCQNHTCVTEEETALTPEPDNETTEFINQVEETIQNKSEELYDLTEAKRLLGEAKEALRRGDSDQAMDLALEALDSIRERKTGDYSPYYIGFGAMAVVLVILVLLVFRKKPPLSSAIKPFSGFFRRKGSGKNRK